MQPRSRTTAPRVSEVPFKRFFINHLGETHTSGMDIDWDGTLLCEKEIPSFEMADQLNVKPTHKTWNGFQHYKRWGTVSTFSARFGVTDAGGVLPTWIDSVPFSACSNLIETGWGSRQNPTEGYYPLMFGPDPEGRFISAVPDEGNLVSIGINRFAPIIKPELESLVSLVELRDFKSIGRTAKRIVSTGAWLKALPLINRVPPRYLGRLLSGARGSLRSLLGSTADGYLQHAFNLAPLMSDIAGLQQAARHTHDRVSKLLQNEGKLITRHTSFDLRPLFDDEVNTMTGYPVVFPARWRNDGAIVRNDNLVGGVATVRRTPEYTLARLNCEIEYTYDYGELTRLNAQLLGHLDSLGIGRNPIKDLWQLIPWSFVVDWMVGIGPLLNRLDNPMLKPSVAVYRFCFSTTVHRSTSVDFNVDPRRGTELDNCDGGGAGRYVTVNEKAYKRIIVDPKTVVAGLTTSGLSRKEVVLASALLFARNRRRSRGHK